MNRRNNNGGEQSAVEIYRRLERQRRLRKKRAASGKVSERVRVAGPPSVKQDPFYSRVFRFRATAVAADIEDNITAEEITRLLGFAVGATDFRNLISAFRIDRVVLWGISDTNPGSTHVELAFWAQSGSDTDSLNRMTDDGSITGNACISAVPPKGSQASFFNTTSDTNLIYIGVSAGNDVTIDVHLTYRLHTATTLAILAGTSMTVGSVLYTPLDNANTTPLLLPDIFGGSVYTGSLT